MLELLKVLVVDDSALMRRLITTILASQPDVQVVGQARNGREAVEMTLEQKPDVITMDVEMPGLNGFEALEIIMRERPTPVVMLSSITRSGAEATIRCLQLGAFDFIAKPSGSISLDLEEIAPDLLAVVRAAASSVAAKPRVRPSQVPRQAAPTGRTSKCILIGSSTGGPRALQHVVPKLPGDLNVPVVIVQHMPPGFTRALAERINSESSLKVTEAQHGDRLEPNTVLIAPGGQHMEFTRNGIVQISDGPTVNGVKPAVDITLSSLVRAFGGEVTGVILTGMGRDGAVALKLLRDAGGRTVVESEETCVVYGMPRAAVEAGAAQMVLPIQEIAPEIVRGVRSTGTR